MSLGRNLKREAGERGWESVIADFGEARNSGKIPDSQISFRNLAEGILGDNWSVKLQNYAHSGGSFHGMEAADAVDASAFVSITGNQLIDTVQKKFENPAFIGDQLVTKIPVTNGNLDTIKEPWLSGVSIEGEAGEGFVTQQGMPYGRTEFKPNYVLLAAPRRRGRIVDVTYEMIYADRTRQAIESAGSVGFALGLAREYEILRVALGITNNFRFSYGGIAETTARTYLKAGTYYSNAVDSLPLTGWADVNTLEQKFSEMRDPVTGVPIVTGAKQLLVMPANVLNAMNILHATQIRTGDGSTSGGVPANTATYGASPLIGYSLLPSTPHLFKVADDELTLQDGTTAISSANTKTVWYMGDFKEALYYREVHGLIVNQAPPLNPAEFEREIVLSVRAKTYGIAGVRNPFHIARAGNVTW